MRPRGAAPPSRGSPPCWGLLAPFPPRFLPLVCASVLPAMPPPPPPNPLAHPEGEIGVTRYLLALSPLASANKFVAALRRYGVARGPASPRKGATARSCARGPGSPLECFSFVCCLSIPLQKRFEVSSSLFGYRGGSGSSPPLPLSGSCKRSHRCAVDPLRGERLSGARLPPLQGYKTPAQAAGAPPLLFFRLPL